MLKIFCCQAVRAVCKPGLLISTSRCIHSGKVPFSGPPSYDTIARRLSPSEIDTRPYFVGKCQQEALTRGKFVIHDIGRNPKDYDVLIPDTKHETFETSIAEELDIPYLSKATESQDKEVVQVGRGYIYGKTSRGIVPFVVGHNSEARWLFFIVDSGAPLTYISTQVSASTCRVEEVRSAN